MTGALDDDERARGRVTAALDDAGSFTSHVDTRTWLVAPSLSVEVGEDTTILAQVLYQRDDYTPSRGMPLRQDGNELCIPNIDTCAVHGHP